MNSSPPAIGDPFPDVPLELPDGTHVKPSDHAGKPLVVFFYPKDDTPGCTTEAIDFTGLKPEFDKAGVALIGVSKDTPAKHAKFIAKHDLGVTLASDAADGGLSDALGIWTEKQNYGRTYMGMVRTTYLIDPSGKIAKVWNKVKVKAHAQAVLEAAQSL